MANTTEAIIYGLRAPPDYPEIRYVGVTKRALRDRLKCHLYRARRGESTHKGAWLRKVLSQGLAVEVVEIERVPIGKWEERERHWIATLPNLTNSVAGGRGVLNPTPEHRLKLSIAHRGIPQTTQQRERKRQQMLGNKHSLGFKHSPETVARLVELRKGKCGLYERTPEIRAKLSASHMGNTSKRGTKCSEESRERMRLAHLGMKRGPHSEETRRKISSSNTDKRRTEAQRSNISAAQRKRFAKQA